MIGYDVETFLSVNQQPTAAENFLGGNKNEPEVLSDDVVCHPDNIMAEFASRKPFHPKDLLTRIRSDFNILAERVAPANVLIASNIQCTEQMLASSRLANEIGCDPDWRGDFPRERISAESIGLNRFAGGHIHFDCHSDLPASVAVRVCDVMLGAPLIAMGEKQRGRRTVYGLSSVYRPKPYGIEYRTLSNYWAMLMVRGMEDGHKFAALVSMTSEVLEKANYDTVMRVLSAADLAAEIIDHEDQTRAVDLLKNMKEYYSA